MSRRPLEAAPAGGCLIDPSRRLVLGGGAALPLVGLSADPAINACEEWLARNAEHERLSREWQRIETRVYAELGWPKLTRRERAKHVEKQQMDELYDRMDVLHEENKALFARLPSIVATTHLGICAKLVVVAVEHTPYENEEIYHLLTSILSDYRALHGAWMPVRSSAAHCSSCSA